MRRVEGWSMLVAAAVCILLSGCSDHEAGAAVWTRAAEDPSTQIIAVDVSEQGTVRITSLPKQLEARTTAAETPHVVLLSADFVRSHGIGFGGGRLPQQAGEQAEAQPIIAVAEGAADALISQSAPSQWLREVQIMQSGLQRFRHGMEGRRRDMLVPYLTKHSGADAIQVKAAVLRGNEAALLLSAEELELLACLNGSTMLFEGRSLGCRTEWRSNGDLKAANIRADVTMTVKPEDPMLPNREASEAAMASKMTVLIHSLQQQGADPLDIGQSVRSLYRGVWTQERWRNAFTHASLVIRLRLVS
jgi:hypothetical protein